MSRSIHIAMAAAMLVCYAVRAQGHVTVSFDGQGKLQDGKAWTDLKKDIISRKPNHIFLVAHGWRTSKFAADETFAYFGKHLREQQGKDGAIEVIGIRWPSLISENDPALPVRAQCLPPAWREGGHGSRRRAAHRDDRGDADLQAPARLQRLQRRQGHRIAWRYSHAVYDETHLGHGTPITLYE